jgi:uncharacterized protein (TIGR04255 family)
LCLRTMSSSFPIPIPARLPRKIEPCPIVEAVFEVRFTTTEPWRTLPGLLHEKIRERYPEQRDLPLAQIPDEIRRQEPTLANLPLMQFLGADFLVQLGPSVINLITKPNAYPGWARIQEQLRWLVEKVQEAGFIREAGRLGVRYIDFFEDDIFSKLALEVVVAAQPLRGSELRVATVLRRGAFTARLLVTNSAILGTVTEAKRGSVLDLDVWLGPLDFELFVNGMDKFSEAHLMVKQCFFGLAKADFVASLNPTYE